MKKVKITVMKKVRHDDLIDKYENPIKNPCELEIGQIFVTDGIKKPVELCDEAWKSIAPFALELANGTENFFDGWMKNKRSAMVSCNDGFRPVSFLLETIE